MIYVVRLISMFLVLLVSGCRGEPASSPDRSTSTVTTLPSPTVEYLLEDDVQDCSAIDSVGLTLELNALHQVIISWGVHGGCAPYRGVLTAWYQDEFKPFARYPISTPNGQLLDTPVLHRGIWDIDYTLEISDGGGHIGRAVQTIGVGR